MDYNELIVDLWKIPQDREGSGSWEKATAPAEPRDGPLLILGVRQDGKGHRPWEAWGKKMIEKIVRKVNLKSDSSIKEDLAFWLSRTPQERIAAIESLRRQNYGSSARLQRSARVVQQTQG